MSNEAIICLLTVVYAAIICIWFYSSWRRKIARLANERERGMRTAEEIRDRIAVATAAAYGQVPIKQCHLEDIKFGELVCWRSEDWQEHSDYVAGYDGDPGPSRDGLHGKPLIMKEP